MSSKSQQTPDWFHEALAVPYENRLIQVAGTEIHYLAWGEVDRPGLLFIHGGAAHAHWWTHIAALFANVYRVSALDLSGHGDSGRRDEYSLSLWCEEVMAVAEDTRMAGPPILVGHSMGGRVALTAAAAHGSHLAGIVIMDSPVTAPDPEMETSRRNQFQDPKVYPDTATAIKRFRTVPAQANYESYIMNHIATMSVRPTAEGVTWKFDPAIFLPHRSTANELLPHIVCRVALFRAEYGLVTPDIGSYMYEQLGRVTPVIEIPLAGHHLMLDQPLLTVTALRTLFADWEHSVPFERD